MDLIICQGEGRGFESRRPLRKFPLRTVRISRKWLLLRHPGAIRTTFAPHFFGSCVRGGERPSQFACDAQARPTEGRWQPPEPARRSETRERSAKIDELSLPWHATWPEDEGIVVATAEPRPAQDSTRVRSCSSAGRWDCRWGQTETSKSSGPLAARAEEPPDLLATVRARSSVALVVGCCVDANRHPLLIGEIELVHPTGSPALPPLVAKGAV